MTVLFLDLDGVVNDAYSDEEVEWFPLWYLTHILDAVPDLRLVISSDWQLTLGIEEIRARLEACIPRDYPIIDTTLGPARNSLPTRQEEVDAWLARHPEVTRYAIVDDHHAFRARFVRTHARGMREEERDELIALLTGEAL